MNQAKNRFDRLPPHDVAAEQALVGCLLLDARTVAPVVAERAQGESIFYDLRHAELARAVGAMWQEDLAVDLVTVGARLKDGQRLEEAGGIGYLTECLGAAPSAANFEHYLAIVWEKFLARRVIQDATSNVGQLMDGRGFTEATLGQMERQVETMAELVGRGSDLPPRYLKRPSDFEDEFLAEWGSQAAQNNFGVPLPFEFPWRIRPAEFTVFTGDTGAGKSSFISHLIAQCMEAGEGACIASMEVRPSTTMRILARQLMGAKDLPTEFYQDEGSGRTKYRLTDEGKQRAYELMAHMERYIDIYDFQGITHWQDILDTFRYVHAKRPRLLYVVDSVMRIGIQDDDYATQGLVAARFGDFALKTKAHLLAVIHKKKKQEGKAHSGKSSIRGTQQWSDNAHNVIEIQINDKKDRKICEFRDQRDAGEIEQAEYEQKVKAFSSEWDANFVLEKQREPGMRQNGSKRLWFDLGSLQFRGHVGDAPKVYVKSRVKDRAMPTREEMLK